MFQTHSGCGSMLETEVISISEAFVNEEKIYHCGILILCEHDPSNPDRHVILLPQRRDCQDATSYDDDLPDLGKV